MSVEVQDAVRAMRARPIGAIPADIDCVIDTRDLRPGQTYLALRGERFDGHAFIAQARDAGAVAAIVEDESVLGGLPGFVVADTKAALMALAAAGRRNFCGAVVAITGSAGKTTTKEFLAQICGRLTGTTAAASPANENNEIGVSKLLLRLTNEAAAIVEMGARHYGDIAPLVAMARPQVGVLTNIGDAHLEIFGTRERLAETKWEIFQTGARAVLSFADQEALRRAPSLPELPWLVGLREERPHAPLPEHVGVLSVDRSSLMLERPGRAAQTVPAFITIDGDHNLRNVAAACGAALALGFPLERIGAGLTALALPAGRYEKLRAASGATIIHDAYNASPGGTIASLGAFAAEIAMRRMVVFGSMAELGTEAVAEHARVATAIAEQRPDLIFFGGDFRTEMTQAAIGAGFPAERIIEYAANTELAQRLGTELTAGDAVLIKGSRRYQLEQVVESLLRLPEAVR